MVIADARLSEAQSELCDLLVRVSDGDRAAFKTLYGRTSPKLFAICLRILSDRAQAEDALQDVYLAVWQKAGSFDRARGSPNTWLAMVARNRAIDRLRQNVGVIGEPIDAGDLADESLPADVAIERQQSAAQLGECLDQLPARDLVLVRTAFMQGSTYSELADRSRLPLGTVKSRIRRALIRLRECLTA